MTHVSVVMSAYNEARQLSRSLSSVRWADEIIFIDNNSTDETVKIAKEYTNKVFQKNNNVMLNINKNFGFTKANSDWILSLDADEVVEESLQNEIIESIQKTKYDGFWMGRKNIIFGKLITHGIWSPDKQLRLFRRNKGAFPCVHVHEYLSVEGQTSDLTQTLTHYNYESISQFLRKMDLIYTESEVEKHIARHYRVVWQDAIRFPVSDFLKIYFAQAGYRDGLHGLVLSSLQAMYAFVVFCKLWEKEGFKSHDISLRQLADEVRNARKDSEYWFLTNRLKESRGAIHSLYLRLKRRYVRKN